MSHDNVTSYRNTEYSSGDTKHKVYQEENNNEVNELSKDLTKMGCIIDKKQPNICVETCVYDSGDDKSETLNDEDAYSDEFEDEKSDDDGSVISVAKSTKSDKSRNTSSAMKASAVKLSQSHTTMSSRKTPSCSGRSTSFGSVSLSQKRVNMSFSNERLREIERHNHILLSKIMSARNTKSSIPGQDSMKKPLPSAAVTRKKQQRQIDHDNMILLKKIQSAKSSSYNLRR